MTKKEPQALSLELPSDERGMGDTVQPIIADSASLWANASRRRVCGFFINALKRRERKSSLNQFL
ncbi:MAG: hypothetical protein ACOX8S_07565 [Christensenellales bacterium]